MSQEKEHFYALGTEPPPPINHRPWWLDVLLSIGCAFVVAIIIAGLVGCAEDRWLTKEEDAEMRAACEPYGGCMLVPNPLWKKIQQLLGMDDA